MAHGASAVIISGNKVLLFLRDDIPTIPFPNSWQLPGGRIEGDETPLEALQRELSEEVTYVPKNLIPVGFFDNKGGHNHIYIAFVTPEEEMLFKHGPGEGQQIKFFTLDEAKQINLTLPLRWFLENKREEIEHIMETHEIPKPEVFGMKEAA